jgi:hypothetical protein
MEDEVSINYSITEDEWVRTAGMRWEENVFPINDCFYGLVSFRIKDEELLGEGRFDISVADLAVGLAQIVGHLRTGACGVLKFQQSDDMLEISFQASKDSVMVSHNLAPDRSWTCNRSALETAIVNLVVSFTNEATGRVADLFGWRDMEILRYFSTEHSSA